MSLPSTLDVDYGRLESIVDLDAGEAYVHVGDGTDDLLRYLARIDSEDNLAAFVMAGGETTICVRPRFVAEANRKFPGDHIVANDTDVPIVETIMDVLGSTERVLVPETVPVGVTRDLSSEISLEVIDEPDTVWCVKDAAEQRVAAHLAEGVQRGMARAESVLAEADVGDEAVHWNGEALTTERLRREIKKALADVGLTDMGNVIVGAGPSCAELHFTGDDVVRPGETVLVDLGPRGPFGYYGDISRTFVPGTPGDWEVEAYEIVREALEAAFDTVSAGSGVASSRLYENIAAVIENHGYEIGLHESEDDAVGLYHGTGHGIGVRIHEKPFQSRDSEKTLEAGNVITIEPGLYDPERGGVRLEDVVVIEDDGYRNLMGYPYELSPTRRSETPGSD